MAKNSRLDIILNDKMTEVFDVIAKEENISRAEVVRRAIATYRVLRDQTKRLDKKVMIEDSDGSNKKELIVI